MVCSRHKVGSYLEVQIVSRMKVASEARAAEPGRILSDAIYSGAQHRIRKLLRNRQLDTKSSNFGCVTLHIH